jgi:hypothetical protein
MIVAVQILAIIHNLKRDSIDFPAFSMLIPDSSDVMPCLASLFETDITRITAARTSFAAIFVAAIAPSILDGTR